MRNNSAWDEVERNRFFFFLPRFRQTLFIIENPGLKPVDTNPWIIISWIISCCFPQVFFSTQAFLYSLLALFGQLPGIPHTTSLHCHSLPWPSAKKSVIVWQPANGQDGKHWGVRRCAWLWREANLAISEQAAAWEPQPPGPELRLVSALPHPAFTPFLGCFLLWQQSCYLEALPNEYRQVEYLTWGATRLSVVLLKHFLKGGYFAYW